MPRPFAIIIRGPLGAGKSTISRALAGSTGAHVIHMDDVPVVEAEWDGGSKALFLRANLGAVAEALPLLAAGTSVIFDQNFYWKGVIEDLERRIPVPLQVFTIKVPLALCIERDRKRKPSSGEEATRQVFAKVNRFEYGLVIDGTQPLATVVKVIQSHLRRQ